MQEWAEIRQLRIAAVSDPVAPLAFLTTRDEELARDDAFWQHRAAGAALSEEAAQFIAADERDRWVGTATVLLRRAGYTDHLGRVVDAPRADVVGVWIAPPARGAGLLGRLIGAGAQWASAQGFDTLVLDVHRDNARAQAAYRKLGFAPTGTTFTSSIGPEIEMSRAARVPT
jgi:RimJ/RimL family protein N-acetyltransferase